MGTMRDNSRQDYKGDNSLGHINAGSLQRIAIATELMAKEYRQLLHDLEWHKKRLYEEIGRNEKLIRSIQAHKANYTRLKRKCNVFLEHYPNG